MGRPSNPTLVAIPVSKIVFEKNVRHAHLWDTEGYNPADPKLYNEAKLQELWDSIADQHGNKTIRYIQNPVVVERDGMYYPQVGNRRCMTLVVNAPDKEVWVEVRSKELSEEEQLAENTVREDQSPLAIACAIEKMAQKDRKAAIRNAGWSDKDYAIWRAIATKMIPDYRIMLETGQITAECALELSLQSEATQKYMMDNIVTAIEDRGKINSIARAIRWSSMIRAMDPRITNTAGTELDIANQKFVLPLTDGMVVNYIVTNDASYEEWYSKYMAQQLKRFGLDTCEDGNTYYSSNLVPYEGGKAYWYQNQVMSVAKEVVTATQRKVYDAQQKQNEHDARQYVHGQMSKAANVEVDKITDVSKLIQILGANCGYENLSDRDVLIKFLKSYYWREEGLRMLMSTQRYDNTVAELHDSFMSSFKEKEMTAQEKLKGQFIAAYSIFMPHYSLKDSEDKIYTYINWLDKELKPVLDIRYHKSVKEYAKQLGVTVNLKANIAGDFKRIARAINEFVKNGTKQDGRDLMYYVEYIESVFHSYRNDIHEQALKLKDVLNPDIDINSKVAEAFLERTRLAFIDYMKAYGYDRKTYLGFVKKDVEERMTKDTTAYNVYCMLVEWLTLRGKGVKIVMPEIENPITTNDILAMESETPGLDDYTNDYDSEDYDHDYSEEEEEYAEDYNYED